MYHLLPVGATLLVDHIKQRGDGEEIVLDDVDVFNEVQGLGLRAARAVYDPVYVLAMLVQHLVCVRVMCM
jgi:hypothetical protein